MDMNEYQKAAASTRQPTTNIISSMCKLLGEAGEVIDLILNQIKDEECDGQFATPTGADKGDVAIAMTTLRIATDLCARCENIGKAIRAGYLECDLDFDESYEATDLTAELGDVLWYVSDLADRAGVPLADVARHNVEKLAARQANGTILERQSS